MRNLNGHSTVLGRLLIDDDCPHYSSARRKYHQHLKELLTQTEVFPEVVERQIGDSTISDLETELKARMRCPINLLTCC